MSAIREYIEGAPLYAKIAAGAVACTGVIAFLVKRSTKKPRKEYPRDTVILHTIGRGPFAPSLSPFVLKLETYLRMTKIPYQCEHDFQRSSKGKFPWIELNGVDVADSNFSIQFLNKTFGVDLDKDLDRKEKATARAWVKMLEENTFWTMAMNRFLFDKDAKIVQYFTVPRFSIHFIRKKIRDYTYGHGIGRHSEEEIYQIMEEDLKALSDYFGDKKFLLGDKPCEEDAAVFGLLAEFHWETHGTRAEKVFKKFPNLGQYCERMKQVYFPDWDECITHGNTGPATK